jgi:hypothetical protein
VTLPLRVAPPQELHGRPVATAEATGRSRASIPRLSRPFHPWAGVVVCAGSVVVVVPFSTPGTELVVVGLWCGPVVGDGVVSVGWDVEVVSDGREVGDSG